MTCNFFYIDINYHTCFIKTLPFINLNPSDLSCIYTSICNAFEESKKIGKNYCFITYDQPLYQKAKEIVSSNPKFNNVVIRLGLYHNIMKYVLYRIKQI